MDMFINSLADFMGINNVTAALLIMLTIVLMTTFAACWFIVFKLDQYEDEILSVH